MSTFLEAFRSERPACPFCHGETGLHEVVPDSKADPTVWWIECRAKSCPVKPSSKPIPEGPGLDEAMAAVIRSWAGLCHMPGPSDVN